MKLTEFFKILDKNAPLSLSYKMIEKGEYDNSGILVKHHDEVNGVLYSLDLSIESVRKAKTLKADTIVTHHPAIYTPVKNIIDGGENTALLQAVNNGLNVISMHLNLDVADGGIDVSLAKALGGDKYKIIDYLDDSHGYGREFAVNGKLSEIKKAIKKKLKTQRVISYGKLTREVKRAASFCGGGAGYAIDYVRKNKTDAELIITSDMPHHVIKELVERGKCIILLTHYTAENYGFKEYYKKTSKDLGGKLPTYYFEDKRFI